MIVACVDCNDHRQRIIGGDERCGEGCQRCEADRRLAGGERDAAGRRDTHAQAGETSGSGRYRDAVERREVDLRPLEHARHQRHQRLGVTALHRHRFMHTLIGSAGVKHSNRASFERGVDGKDSHTVILASFMAGPVPAIHVFAAEAQRRGCPGQARASRI